VSQFNAAQRNAIDQYNVDQVNSIRRFNAEMQQQRDLFNAQNGLVIAQANAQWRQNLTTLNTAAQNESNRQFAQVLNNMSQTSLDQIWQRERDIMAFAFQQAENAAERAANVALAKLTADEQAKLQDNIGKGKLMATVVDNVLNFAIGQWG
jgi:ribosome biogenesis protein Nip4